jgi:hypothetical protein
MKKLLLASAAFVICALPMSAQSADMPLKASPVMAVPEATGYVEVYGGWASTRNNADGAGVISSTDVGFTETFAGSERDSIKGSVLGGAARGNYWATPTVSMQLDVQAEGTSYNFSNCNSSSSCTGSSLDYLIGGHLNWRDSSRGLLGAFAGIGDNNGVRHAVFGAEGQYYWNNVTFYLQGGYDTTLHSTFAPQTMFFDGSFPAPGFIGPFSADMDAWFIRGTGRYYVTPNLRIEATGMYAGCGVDLPSSSCSFPDCAFNSSFNTLLWEAKAEWKMDNSPFAFFFKYRGSQTDYNLNANLVLNTSSPFVGLTGTATAKVTDNRFLVGVRMYLGEKSLLWNDRQGATLDIISPLAIQSGPLYASPGVIGLNEVSCIGTGICIP